MKNKHVVALVEKAYQLRNIVAVDQSSLSKVDEKVRAVYDKPVVIYKKGNGTIIAYDMGAPFINTDGLDSRHIFFQPVRTSYTEGLQATLKLASLFRDMAHRAHVLDKMGHELYEEIFGKEENGYVR